MLDCLKTTVHVSKWVNMTALLEYISDHSIGGYQVSRGATSVSPSLRDESNKLLFCVTHFVLPH